jgi:hypothetical protein
MSILIRMIWDYVYMCLRLNGPIFSSFNFCVSTMVVIHDLSRQVVMTLGEGSSICMPLPIDCLISYCLVTYTMFVQSKMTMLLYIGGDIRTV